MGYEKNRHNESSRILDAAVLSLIVGTVASLAILIDKVTSTSRQEMEKVFSDETPERVMPKQEVEPQDDLLDLKDDKILKVDLGTDVNETAKLEADQERRAIIELINAALNSYAEFEKFNKENGVS